MMTTFPSMLLLMALIPDLHDGRSAMDRSVRPYPRYWSSLTFFNQSTLFPIQRFLNDDPRRRVAPCHTSFRPVASRMI